MMALSSQDFLWVYFVFFCLKEAFFFSSLEHLVTALKHYNKNRLGKMCNTNVGGLD